MAGGEASGAKWGRKKEVRETQGEGAERKSIYQAG